MKINTKILLLLVISLCVSCNRHVDKQILKEKISGLVVKKYRDKINHGSPCVDLKDGTTLGLLLWHSDTSDLWEFIAVGDSVYKPYGVYLLKVIKPSGETKEYPYNFE
jgi:hypothetical protein